MSNKDRILALVTRTASDYGSALVAFIGWHEMEGLGDIQSEQMRTNDLGVFVYESTRIRLDAFVGGFRAAGTIPHKLLIARKALHRIHDLYGKVCDRFESCEHPACGSSYGSHEIASQAIEEIEDSPK